jgi:hypothetical protein
MINCVDFKARGDRPVADGYLIKISKNKLFFECMAEKKYQSKRVTTLHNSVMLSKLHYL